MPDFLAALQLALMDRYAIERELGAGGMSSVYLARDLRHDRLVAIKVVRPELAAVVGPERFLREIETTAKLSHPAILPLFDSGNANGILWYAMPYFTGKSLKDRLDQEGSLPLDEALALFRDVAGALDYAHRQGVLHRDLKPANILLQDGRAVLADFGIALPVGGTGERMTASGLSIGTPEYMSPEQALAERNLDARSDIYALGCVLYEMLAGEPPFTGANAQAIVAKRLMGPVPRLSTVRDVPEAVDHSVSQALSRQPKDRFESVAAFARAVESLDPSSAAVSVSRPPQTRWLQPRVIGALLLLVVVGAVSLLVLKQPAVAFDPNLVVILPARINAPTGGLDYLREGILDLAATRLTGEGGPRAVDPRTTLAAIRSVGEDNLSGLAARLGSGKLLEESIVGDGRHLTLSATLIGYPGGTRQPTLSVEGSEDSLGILVDRLMIRVLAMHAGERATALTQVKSLPAWRAYLGGKAAYRAGRYSDAVVSLEQALSLDSTFTLAALADMTALTRAGRDASELAASIYRDLPHLSADDSLWFFAMQGPRYPGGSGGLEQLAALERAVSRMPDNPDGWFELGDLQLHNGAVNSEDHPLDNAKRSFQRALTLDSSFALPIDHLLLIAYAQHDTAQVRQLTTLYLAHDSLGERTGFVRWRSAVELGDSAAVGRERARFSTLPQQSLQFIAGIPQNDGIGMGDAILADSILATLAATEDERDAAHFSHSILRLNLGQATAPPIPLPGAPIDNALFTDGDPALADSAARLIRAEGQLKSTARHLDWVDRWELAAWDLTHHEIASAEAIGSELKRRKPTEWSGYQADSILLPRVLDAWIATERHDPKALGLVGQVDSIMATAPPTFLQEEISMCLSRMFMALNQPERALRAARRTQLYIQTPYAAATSRLAQARAAAAAGQREAAVDSYRIYLALRQAPDARLVPQRDSARMELAGVAR